MLPRSILAFLVAAVVATGSSRARAASAHESTMLALAQQLQDRDLPDVMLWVIEQAAASPECSAETRRRLDFLKGSALAGQSRTAADPDARERLLDEAERAIDAFLASSPDDDTAIAAFTQKGNLLVERGRICLARVERPGADRIGLTKAAAGFFDQAITTLRPSASPGQADAPSPPVTAEDAVLRALRGVDAELERIRLPLQEIRTEHEAKTAELAPIQKEIAALDGQIRQKQADVPMIQAELVEVQKIPSARSRPLTPKEVQDRRILAGQLTARLQTVIGEIAALEAKRLKPEAQLRRVTAERTRISKQMAAAEKPLEKELELPLQRQEQLRTKLLQTRLMVAEAWFEKSKAYPADSPEWKAALGESLRLNHELAEKYATLGVGSVGRLNEGRCQALLGDRDAAVATLAPLFTLEAAPGQPLSPLGLSLKTKALGIALSCWLEDGRYGEVTGPTPFEVDKYRGNPHLRFALTPVKEGRMTAEMAAVKVRTAELLVARARAGAVQEPAAVKLLEADAATLAREVSAARRDFAKEARELATALGKNLGPVADDFPTKLAVAQAAFRDFQEAEAAAKAVRTDGAAPAAAGERSVAARDEALAALRAALALGEEDASADEAAVNQVRSMLAFVLYEARAFTEAAAVGTLLVRDHPNAASSRQAARVALASLQALAAEGPADAKTRLGELATLVVTRWPDGPEAADATTVLVGLAGEAHDADALVGFVERMHPSIPRRPELLLRAAVGLRQEAESRRQRGEIAAAASCRAAALRALDEALPAIEAAGSLPDGPTAGKVIVTAAVMRAQLALGDGDLPLALAVLTNPVYGPWTLASSETAPVFMEGPLATTTLTVALNAFVEAQRFDAARQAMELLERAAAGGEGAARLTAMYRSLGKGLQDRLEQLTAAGGGDAVVRAAPLLVGFESFLDGVARRDPATAAQLWVATTYQTLGSGTSAVVPRAKAGQYLERAAEAYGRLLARLDQSDLEAAEAAELRRFEPTVRLRIAALARERGRWDEAQKQIDALLADPLRQNWLDAQVEAAELLLAAGRAAKAAGDAATADVRLREAAAGRSGASVIWGWGAIATKVSRQAFDGADAKAMQARDLFFRARLKVAEALLLRAETKASPTERTTALEAAETSITMTRKLYPDLGGPVMQSRFENLLKTVQTALGKPADGFAGDRPSATP